MTGENIWKEEPSFNGTVTRSILTEKGIAVVIKNSIDANSINIIDLATGKFLWPSSVKVSGQCQKLEIVPNGLLYATPRTVNILGLDGNTVTTLPVQSLLKKPVVTEETKDKFYYYSSKDNNLYEIDKTKGSSRVFNQKPIDFKSSEEPELIEIIDAGVLLYAKQNAVLLLPDGNIKFSVYRPSPSDIFSQLKKDVVEMVAKDSVKESTKSISTNSTSAANYLYMTTRSRQSLALMAIDKNSGHIISTVDFLPGDDQPAYQIDKVRGILFYAPKGKDDYGSPTHVGEIWCWKL